MKKIMMMIGAIIVLSISTLAANAATLTNINGDVKVNRGNGYQTVRGSVNLNPGDKVLVGQNGSANIAYANGTSVPLGSGVTSVTTAVGSAGLAAGGLGTTALVVGGAVAVGVGVAVVVANSGNDTPASP